ncbi:uncharacterized protein [Euphorbia lathyris]|uniref:uncharacterized protein n=1 Tax=Euphorbia lathyris TaxID=212925 RepID=UPI0033144ECE
MLLRIEKQCDVSFHETQADFANITTAGHKTQNASSAATKNYRSTSNSSNSRTGFKRKEDKFCHHCKKGGHEKHECFHLNGYPEWYKGKKVSGVQGSRNQQANFTQEGSTPLDNIDSDSDDSGNTQMVKQLVQKEISKLMKGKTIDSGGGTGADFSAFAGACAGPEF